MAQQFLLFSTIFSFFNIALTSRVKLRIHFLKCSCSIYFVLNSANLICGGTDISKYFKKSLESRDNESRNKYGIAVMMSEY